MIFAKIFARNSEKNNTWNIRRLVDELLVPPTQHIILKIVVFLYGYIFSFFLGENTNMPVIHFLPYCFACLVIKLADVP